MTIEEYNNLKVGDHILWLNDDRKIWVAIVKSVKPKVNTICIYTNYKSYESNFEFKVFRCEEFKLLTEEEVSKYYKLSVFK